MEPTSTGVVIVSGGLDSTTLLYKLIREGVAVRMALSFNYGQRHAKELEYAKASAHQLEVPHTIIDLWSSGLPDLLSQSASSLVSDSAVPEGHYGEENMKATVVPNRNMIMLSIAGGVAVALGAQKVYIGVHAGDHFIYPDCRPEFIRYASEALLLGNEGFGNLIDPPIEAPYSYKTKADIVFDALELGIPLDRTWSCYKGGDFHCGRCGTCVERLEAIATAQAKWEVKYGTEGKITAPEDPTYYQDKTFWREAIERETV